MDCPPTRENRNLLALAVLALLFLQGCAATVKLQNEDIADRLWLQRADGNVAAEGFFAGADGSLLLVGKPGQEGVFWELHDNALLLWLRTDDQVALQTVEYYPLSIDDKQVLRQGREDGSPVVAEESRGEPLGDVRYELDFLRNSILAETKDNTSQAYLVLSAGDGVLLGYGGVNNFYGSYERSGVAGFKAGPFSTTMMIGPALVAEMSLMECLDQAESILAVRKQLFFYRQSRLLCSFHAR